MQGYCWPINGKNDKARPYKWADNPFPIKILMGPL